MAAAISGCGPEPVVPQGNGVQAEDDPFSWIDAPEGSGPSRGDPAALPDDPTKGAIGVKYQESSGHGCYVVRASPGMPAANAGLRTGDVIFKVGNVETPNGAACKPVFAGLVGGRPVELVVEREGREMRFVITPVTRAEAQARHAAGNDEGTFPSHPGDRPAAAPQRSAYGLVVGVEHYRDLPAPPGARADAEAFATMLTTTLGLPEANVRLAIDDRATGKDFDRHLAWLKLNVPAGGRVYFFFSGHGAPDATKGTSFLVPYDGDAQAIAETSVELDHVLAVLGETKAKETLAFVDACFSGAGGRSILPKGARPLIKLKDVQPGPKTVALFAASSGTQISGTSAEGTHGAFTKYLLQGVEAAKADVNGDGKLTLRELAEWVTPRVEREARAQNREQTPKLASRTNPADLEVAWGLK